MSEGVEYGPDTFEVCVEKTLRRLSTFDFKNLSKYVNTDRPNYYKFNTPDSETEIKSLFLFTSTILELSKISNIKQNGGYRETIDEILVDLSKNSLFLLNMHASEENNVANILLSLSEDKHTSQGRVPIPFTGGNLGIWVNVDKSISFTGNRYYDKAADVLNEFSKKINFNISKS